MPGPFVKNTAVFFNAINGNTIPKETLSRLWYTSNRFPGTQKLNLQPNEFSQDLRHNMSYWQQSNPHGYLAPEPPSLGALTSNEPEIVDSLDSLYNQCYGKFWSKVNGDTAGLGMSLSTWKQGWDMIKNSSDRIYSYAKDAAFEAERRNRKGKRLKKERAADVFLEYQFGWVPLLGDILNSAKILAGLGSNPNGNWIRGSADAVVTFPDIVTPTRRETGRTAKIRRCISAKVAVSNPNLWLLNQLGLVNPVAIAWDRVPWSFVVNQFANVNNLINSFTNEVGLSVNGNSDTITIQLFDSIWMANTYPPDHPFYATASSSAMQRVKSRSLGPFTAPKLQVYLPGFSMTKGLIASSLAYQQVSRLRK